MEKENKITPRVYYLREVVDTEGGTRFVMDDKPETGEVYQAAEVFDEKGRLHVFFIKNGGKAT